MSGVVVPVRYPLTDHSTATLAEAVEIAEERETTLTVFHVNLHHTSGSVTRAELKRAVETAFGRLPRARYVVHEGFLVEEAILEEVVAEDADVVVIGRKQLGRWRRAIRKLISDPDIEGYLREKLDCEVVTVDS